MPELTKEITVEFEVWCGTCGAGLCMGTSERRDDRGIDVEACEKCLAAAHDEGEASRNDEVAEMQATIEALEEALANAQSAGAAH